MIYEAMDPGNIDLFRQFCRTHRPRLDESYISDDELAALAPSGIAPTWMALDEGSVIAAASLVMDDYHLRGRRARFRILFSERAGSGIYRGLLDRLRIAARAVDSWFFFVKDGHAEQMRCAMELGFQVERTSYVLMRRDLPVGPVNCPPGVRIRPFMPGQDEAAYVHVRNQAFANLMGSQTPITEEHVVSIVRDGSALPGGIFMLEADGVIAGVVCTGREPGDDGGAPSLEIGPLAILPQYQGKGLGTLLLRRALQFGREQAGLPQAVLCVSAENAPALGLYLREGFTVVQDMTCMSQQIKNGKGGDQ